jgi:hypothetical protein
MIFALIHPLLEQEQEKEEQSTNTVFKTMDHCGFEDTIINHLLYLKTDGKKDASDLELLGRRNFNVQCMSHMESLGLTFHSLDIIKKDFSS